MKILIFEQRYTRKNEAGIGRFNIFSKYWAERGHEIYVVAGMINYLSGKKADEYKGRFFVEEKDGENITVFRAFDSVLGYRTFLGRLWSYFSFLFSALITSLFLIPNSDVIIASSPPIFIGALGWLTSVFKGAPFVFEVRDLWPDEAVELGFLKNNILIKMSLWLEKFLYNRAKAIVVNSPGLKEFLVSRKSVPNSKITVVPNPVNSESFKEPPKYSPREKFNWGNKFVVLYAGSMSAVYDFDIVLDVSKELKDKPILFVFLGDGRQKQTMRERAKRESIENVQFLDSVSAKEVRYFVRDADVGIATLKKEIGLLKYVYASKLFSYMAGKKPIVLAMEGASADLIQAAHSGICLSPGDKNAFQKVILDLYKDSDLRQKLGESGFQYVNKNLNPEKLAEEYFSVLTN